MPSIGGTESEDSETNVDNSDTVVSSDAPIAEYPLETPQSAVDEALQLYLEYINELRNDIYFNDFYGTMSLVFIDDDDIPELVIARPYPHDALIICTVSNGALVTTLVEGGGGGINYIDRGNKFTYIAGIQDIHYDFVCCIEDGTFVILHEGSQDSSGNQFYWDGEAVSYSEYIARQEAAFDVSISEHDNMSYIRTADMIYEINVQLSGSPTSITTSTHDPISGLLTSDGAFAVYDSWLDNHTDMTPISRQSEIYEYRGEQYYHFPAKSTYNYYYNILVHMESGKLLHMLIEDGMYPITLIEPLDNWYDKTHDSLDTTQILDIINYLQPPMTDEGGIFGVIGTIVSNYQILSVSVMVCNDRGEVETIGSASPLTNAYDINQLEYDLRLDTLTPGGKTYMIEATDETGTITLESWFWVN